MQKIEILKSKELVDYPYSIKIMENIVLEEGSFGILQQKEND